MLDYKTFPVPSSFPYVVDDDDADTSSFVAAVDTVLILFLLLLPLLEHCIVLYCICHPY